MTKKLLIQMLACLVAVTVWGAGLPLVQAASTASQDAATSRVAESPAAVAAWQGAGFPDATSWAEKQMLVARANSTRVDVAAPVSEVDSGDTDTAATPEPTAAATPEPKPEAAPERTARPDNQARPAATPKPDATPRPDPTPKPEASPDPEPTPKPEPKPDPSPTYEGKSRFWYPALGISVSWKWYGCEYGGDADGLGAGVYRWGCVDGKNSYLMSHAWSTFAAVRRGYHSGRMDEGQSVWYSDRSGNVVEYRVKWIKRVDTDYFMRTFGEWAAISSSTPMITLQTCDGSDNQYRIIVRLVPA